ncbi:MraY family glycosyltransferase [Methyloversatilis thermotolerans]|uniref:MraY family glycosyltransferase n=1 Tax=Methyloversatilis thermotolerans TaxID=1346290 RepID=UPI00035FD79F|nr:glycosyltransferase family 4 protein [Methyloversatilis thermotolerans]
MSIEILAPALAAFVLTGVILQLALQWARHLLPVDQPNERSLHVRPIPRFGGLAMLAGGALALAWANGGIAFPHWLWPLAVLAAVSLADDFLSLPFLPRLLIQLAVATVFVMQLPLHVMWVVPLVLAMVWMTNLFNFMDGSDGLAGSMALTGFAAYALAAALAGDVEICTVSLAVCGAALAFLLRNRHPASVFMGDGGSIPLGFLAAAVGLLGVVRDIWAPWFPLLAFLVFVLDATATLVQRGLRGERVWQAHRTHYYQRLVRMGFGHAATARLYAVAMTGCAASAVLAQQLHPWAGYPVLFAWTALAVAWGRRLDRRWAHHQSEAAGSAS